MKSHSGQYLREIQCTLFIMTYTLNLSPLHPCQTWIICSTVPFSNIIYTSLCKSYRSYSLCSIKILSTYWDIRFYPRPVLAFGYCRCLRLCVCVSVCLCVNHLLVRAITRDLFKLGSPNLDQRCKRPWLRSLLFLGPIDLDLQGQI